MSTMAFRDKNVDTGSYSITRNSFKPHVAKRLNQQICFFFSVVSSKLKLEYLEGEIIFGIDGDSKCDYNYLHFTISL